MVGLKLDEVSPSKSGKLDEVAAFDADSLATGSFEEVKS